MYLTSFFPLKGVELLCTYVHHGQKYYCKASLNKKAN